MRQSIRFYEQDVDSLFNSNRGQIEDRINSESEDYILNVGEEQYIQALESQFNIDFPTIDTENVHADNYETEIPGSRFPGDFFVNPSKSYRKEIIVFHIPYTGNINVLKFRPNSFARLSPKVTIDPSEQCILIEIINFSNDAEAIKRTYDDSLRHILSNYGSLKSNFDSFNSGLNSFIASTLRNRKEQIQRSRQFLSSLGVPLKKKSTTPETFAIPKPRLREKIIVKPVVHSKGFQPEPTLDEENYSKILKIINDVGKNFERLPSVYKDKEEEHLRDHILLTLDPNFEFGSASGETFNKSGKTDIQLRYDSSVVFIAECKIWRGEKKFIEGIDQLLKYLTWRDSKTAYIVFVPNKDFSSVLHQINGLVMGHGNYIKSLSAGSDTWFNFIFNLPADSNKEIKLTVLLYHIPTD
jgi:hypothetical protein